VAIERTLCIIKPDAVEARNQGVILQLILDAGFSILASRQLHLGKDQASAFYAVHKQRPFFGELVDFMSSGPIVVAALEAENAVNRYRELIGATDPAKAAEGTIRNRFGAELSRNAVHGSDSVANGDRETSFFFSGWELGERLT
jgi:nucleoside-diphosphate kinase